MRGAHKLNGRTFAHKILARPNCLLLSAQFFMKIPALKALAPTQSEPPFLGAQVVVMLIFIALGVLAAKRFPAETIHPA